MKKSVKKTCSYYKPICELPFSQNYNTPSCSHCAYFSTRNCHLNAIDTLDADDLIY